MLLALRVFVLAGGVLGLYAGWLAAGGRSLAAREAYRPDPVPRKAEKPLHTHLELGESLLQVAERDPFRAERRPAPVAYDPEPAALVQAAEPPRPKPALLVTGILWSPDPVVIVEGLPGVDGSRVLTRGEALAGITVRSISPTAAVLAGLDTVWRLEVRQPWR